MAVGGRGHTVVGVAYFFVVLSTIPVFLRCYVRLRIVKNFGVDDAFNLLAWALFMINLSFLVTAAHHGSGQHLKDIPHTEIILGLKWWWFCEPVFVLASMAIKFSIGIYLVRIAQIRLHRIILWTGIIIMEVFSLFFFFLFIFQCHPVAYFWTRFTGTKGSCINLDTLVAVTYAYSAIACVTDWLYAVMPVFLLWDLEMDRKTKICVGVLIAMGASASIATVIRIPYLESFRNTADFLYATTDVALWTTVELGIGLFAGSLATLRPLFRKFMGGGSSAKSEGTGTTSSRMSWAKRYRKGHVYMRSESRLELRDGEHEMHPYVRPNFDNKTDVENQVNHLQHQHQQVVCCQCQRETAPCRPQVPPASFHHPSDLNSVEIEIADRIEEQQRIWTIQKMSSG